MKVTTKEEIYIKNLLNRSKRSVRFVLGETLYNMFEGEYSLKSIRGAIKSDKLRPGRPRGYGSKAHKELCNLVGIEYEGKWKFDPYTGKPFRPKN